MRILVFIFFCSILFSCEKGSKEYGGLRIPGEFEPHSAVWLGFRSHEYNQDYDSLTVEIVRHLHQKVPVNLVVEHDSLAPEGLAFFYKRGIDTSKIRIIFQDPTDDWFRDAGPIFGISEQGNLILADFKYTDHTNSSPDSLHEKAILHEGIDRDIAKRLQAEIVPTKIAMEGGAFEINGRGTVILTESVALGRNPHLSKEEIENELKSKFNIQQVIWLHSGVADDPQNFNRIHGNYYGFGTGGHTDEFVRFANDSTILLGWINSNEKDDHIINELNYNALSKSLEILQNHHRKNGKPFSIIKVPHPYPETEDYVIHQGWESGRRKRLLKKFDLAVGDTIQFVAASSYLNYIISNGIVIIPKYWEPGKPEIIALKDREAFEIFKAVFPDREIVPINPLVFNWDGGGMHCRNQTQPKTDSH